MLRAKLLPSKVHQDKRQLDAEPRSVENVAMPTSAESNDPTDENGTPGWAGSAKRQSILDAALALMAQRGVDGTSMRDLASATQLNVASLYHYFPSKRDLLVEILSAKGVIQALTRPTLSKHSARSQTPLADLLESILSAMLQVEDFVRLMLGEALRGDTTAFEVGTELLDTTQTALERWASDLLPELCDSIGPSALAQVLRSMLLGTFVEYLAGVCGQGPTSDPHLLFRARAEQAASILEGMRNVN